MYVKGTQNIQRDFKSMSPVVFKLGLSVGILEGDLVGCTDGVDVGYSEKQKGKWIHLIKYMHRFTFKVWCFWVNISAISHLL